MIKYEGSDGTWFFEGKAYTDREWRGHQLPTHLRKKWIVRREAGKKQNRRLVKEGKLRFS